MKLYDSRFDNIEIEHDKIESFIKPKAFDVIDENVQEHSYVTLSQLQEEFGVSRYQIVETLKKLGASPIGVKKNIVEGKRLRGVGRNVYDVSIVEDIYAAIPVDDIKEMARQILEE